MNPTEKFKKVLAVTTISALLFGQPVYALDQSGFKTSNPVTPNYLPALEVNSSGSRNVEKQYADHQLFLKFKDAFDGESGLLKKYKLTVIKRNTKTGYILASFTGNTDVQNLVEQIQQEAGVIHAQPNYLYKIFSGPNDPMYSRQWALPSINAVPEQTAAGSQNTTAAKPVILAILDTGVDVNHPDLKDRLVPGTNTTNPLKSTRDSEGHGTHVAGIAAASTNNGLGVAGIAGANVKIMPIKVFEGDGGSDVSISDGIIWAADHGAKVINMSFGTFYKSTVLNDAIDYAYEKGVVMVAAAGNWASEEISYPAALSKVISVSAINKQNQLADFSSYGPMIDVCAPGEEIYSTFWDPYKGSTYTELSGTSMASPMVAGVAAAMLAKRPQLNNEEVRQILEASATDLGTPGWDTKFGHGKINMAKALTLSLSKIDDKNGSMSKAVPLVSGEAQRDKIDFGSDEDWYKISLPDRSHLQIEVLPAGKVSPGVEVYNSLGKVIASFNTGANQPTAQNAFADMDQRQLKVAEAINGLVPDLIRGTYYIKVFGNHYRWTEETYSVKATVISKDKLVQDKYEPNNTYKKASTISTRTAVEGAILDAADQDWYKIKLTGKTYKIHLDVPAGLDLAVDVESEANYANTSSGTGSEDNYGSWFYQTINNGGLGEAEDALVVLPDKGRGNYYLNIYEVSGGSFNQNYVLKINEQTLSRDAFEPNDTYAKAAGIKIGQQVSGNFNVEGDNDWYTLDVDKEGVLKLTLKRPENSWCDVNLYADPKKSPVGQNYLDYAGYTSTDSGMLDLFQKERTYEFKVLPGTYYLNVSSFDGGISDAYTFTTSIEAFSFIDKEFNDMPSSALPLNNTESKGTIYPANDIDIFTMDLENTHPLIVKVVPPADLNTHVVVMRETSDSLGSHTGGGQTGSEGSGQKGETKFTEPLLEMVTAINTGGKGKPDLGVFTPSKPGKYYIIVLAQGKSKPPYTISIQSFTPTPDKWEDNSTLSKAKAIACGTTVYPTFMGIEDQDWYKTYVGGKGKLEVRLDVPDDIDGVLEVYNQQGKLIARTDQSLIGEEEHLLISAVPGYYYIKTYDYLGNSSVQNYSLQVKLTAQTK